MRVELADDLVDSVQFLYECGVIENLALPKGQPLAQFRRGLGRQALDVDVQRAGNIGEGAARWRGRGRRGNLGVDLVMGYVNDAAR